MPIWGLLSKLAYLRSTKMTLTNAHALNYDRLLSSTLGFDRIFNILENTTATTASFPPVNIVKIDEDNFVIELAVAGYKQSEIEITSQLNNLKIVGKKEERDERTYVTKGIAGRSFSRDFTLADTIVVRDADLVDGILSVHLENVIPEERKPRKIAIKQTLPALEEK